MARHGVGAGVIDGAAYVVLGGRQVLLYPLYHPAAALYTPSMLETLRADFRRIPELLALPAPPQPEPEEAELVVPEPEVVAELAAALREMAAWQGLDDVVVGDRGDLAAPLTRVLR